MTIVGLKKLQAAEVMHDEFGQKRTLEKLSEQTILNSRTVARIINREEKVDKRSLKQFFETFNLELKPEDYTYPSNAYEGYRLPNSDLQSAMFILVLLTQIGRSHSSSPTHHRSYSAMQN